MGSEKALLLVGELGVEGLARDARAVDHVGDPDVGVAQFGDDRDHRPEQAFALGTSDLRGGKGPATAREAALDVDVAEAAHRALLYSRVLLYYFVPVTDSP